MIRHRALVERAKAHLIEGKRPMARKDVERVLAEDFSYEGLRDLLAQLEDSPAVRLTTCSQSQYEADGYLVG